MPAIINAGTSYRFHNWHRPGKVDGSLSPLGARYLYGDDLDGHVATMVGFSAVVDKRPSNMAGIRQHAGGVPRSKFNQRALCRVR